MSSEDDEIVADMPGDVPVEALDDEDLGARYLRRITQPIHLTGTDAEKVRRLLG